MIKLVDIQPLKDIFFKTVVFDLKRLFELSNRSVKSLSLKLVGRLYAILVIKRLTHTKETFGLAMTTKYLLEQR